MTTAHARPSRVPKSHRILIVEDEGLIAVDLAACLESLGHTVVETVATAEDAVRIAPQSDVVLMDIRIDGPRDGIDAAMEIDEKFSVPVIFMTAQTDGATLDRAIRVNPYGFLVKPVGLSALQAAIELAISNHRREACLKEQLLWLRAAFASAPGGIIVTTPGGTIRFLNPTAERITGYSNEQALGLDFASVTKLPADLVDLAILHDAPMEVGAALLEGHLTPIRDETQLVGTVFLFRGVAAERLARQRHEQGLRLDAAARLAASVSEQFANRLAVISAHADRLSDQWGEYSAVGRSIEEIRRAAAEATQITKRMASFTGNPEAHLEIFTLNSVLRRLSGLIESTAGRRIKTTIRIDQESGQVRANQERVEQAILNLAFQCCAVMPEGGRLTLETSRAHSVDTETGAVMLNVECSGQFELDRIFEPSASPDQSQALPVAHAIVREAGGTLSARQAASGGTQFELMLPRVAGDARPQTLLSAGTVLLVEGRDRIRGELHKFFETAGFNLIETANASEAVAMGEMFEGNVDILIAEESVTEELTAALGSAHPAMAVLKIVDEPDCGPDEIQRPFAQKTLLEKASALIRARQNQAQSAAS